MLFRSIRWLRAISTYRATTSGAPNFAYETCVKHISDAQIAELDLSSWALAFSGSEPVRYGTMQRFAERFAPAGLAPHALYPCYGLAEATLFVAGRDAGSSWVTRVFDRQRFAALTSDGTMQQPLVSCGWPRGNGRVIITSLTTGSPAGEGEVGEICVAGDHVSPGQWSSTTPGGVMPHHERLRHINGTDFLQTGDAGVIEAGELFVVGRLKDIVIIRGANIYAEDVENTLMVQEGTNVLTAVAAVAIEGTSTEELVILCELEREARVAPPSINLAMQWRARIADLHGAQGKMVLVAPGALPRTTSGKIQRGTARAAFLEGILPTLEWQCADE